MEKINEKNNNEEKKKGRNRKLEDKAELKFLQNGEILLISTSNNKVNTYCLGINNNSTVDILNCLLGQKDTVYEKINYIMFAYKNNLVESVDYFILNDLKFFKPLGLIKKFSLYKNFSGNINTHETALHYLRIALFLFLFEECTGEPLEVLKKFRERKRKTWRTIKEYNLNTLLAYIRKATKKKFKNIVNDDELFKAKSHKYKFPEDFTEYNDEIDAFYLRSTLSEYSKYLKQNPLKIVLQREALNEIFKVVFEKGSEEEKKLFITFLNIHLYPNAWSEALKINNLKWNTYKKLMRKIKKY